MTLPSTQYAGLAANAYEDRRVGWRRADDPERHVVDGVAYKVLAHADNPRTGYQGTVYQRVDTGEIVVAHRGTEQLVRDGVITDGAMVVARTNPQAPDAIALTRQAMQYARQQAERTGQAPEVSVTGHSLGGALAQITAHHFDLRGETFNAYGAASLGYRIPEGGGSVVNHVMATDPVSAASGHYGQVRIYATEPEIQRLQATGYSNSRFNALIPDQPLVAAGASLGAHSMHNFLPVDGNNRPDRSVLTDERAVARAADNARMIDEYRDDVHALRRGVTTLSRSPVGHAIDAIDAIRGPLPAGEPARREAPAAPRIDDPRHPQHPLFRGADAGVSGHDARVGRTSDLGSRQLAGALAAEMHAAGGTRVDHVAMSPDAARTFAVQGRLDDPAHLRVGVDTVTAMATPLEASTRRIAELDAQAQSARAPEQALEQAEPARSRAMA